VIKEGGAKVLFSFDLSKGDGRGRGSILKKIQYGGVGLVLLIQSILYIKSLSLCMCLCVCLSES
jgi:hypothetical protein